MSDLKNDGTPTDKAQKPKQSKRPPVKPTHVTQPFLNVRVPKGATKKTVETAVIEALDDKAPTFVNNSQGDGTGPHAEASLKSVPNVAAAAETSAKSGSTDTNGGTQDTKFFKDEKDALLMIVNQEGQ